MSLEDDNDSINAGDEIETEQTVDDNEQLATDETDGGDAEDGDDADVADGDDADADGDGEDASDAGDADEKSELMTKSAEEVIYTGLIRKKMVIKLHEIRNVEEILKKRDGDKWAQYGYIIKSSINIKRRSEFKVTKNSTYECEIVYSAKIFNVPMNIVKTFKVVDLTELHAIIDFTDFVDEELQNIPKIIYVPLELYEQQKERPLQLDSQVSAKIIRRKFHQTPERNIMTYTAIVIATEEAPKPSAAEPKNILDEY